MLLWFIENPRKKKGSALRTLPGLYSTNSLILLCEHKLVRKADCLSKPKIRGAEQSKSSSEID